MPKNPAPPPLPTTFDSCSGRGITTNGNTGSVVVLGEFGRSPQRGVSTSGNDNSDDGRDHWPYCYTSLVAGAGIKRGIVYGKSDKTASAPIENAVHPTQLLATIYYSMGIDPGTIVYNHLNQPRELVKAEIVGGIIA